MLRKHHICCPPFPLLSAISDCQGWPLQTGYCLQPNWNRGSAGSISVFLPTLTIAAAYKRDCFQIRRKMYLNLKASWKSHASQLRGIFWKRYIKIFVNIWSFVKTIYKPLKSSSSTKCPNPVSVASSNIIKTGKWKATWFHTWANWHGFC